MAKKQITQTIDDLDGAVLENGVTVDFSLNGQSYEIDLSDANAERLQEALRPFIEAGRLVPGSRRSGSRRRAAPVGGRVDLTAVREWARANGLQVSDRGRIPGSVQEAYNAAHGS